MTGRRHTHRTATDQLREALDGDLLALWCDGHPEGLDELARRHHAWLLRTVRMLSGGEHDPEAIVQDVWLDVMRGAATYRGDGAVRAWLSTIVRRRINSTWRARDSRPHTLVAYVPETSTASETLDDNVILRAQLRGLLAGLPADQRDAVWLVDVVGLPIEEVAHRLGVPVGTVKSRCHRGRARLRLHLRADSSIPPPPRG